MLNNSSELQSLRDDRDAWKSACYGWRKKTTELEAELAAAKKEIESLKASIGMMEWPAAAVDYVNMLETKLGAMTNELDKAAEELAAANAYADKLAAGLPDGMLPKDISDLRQANWKLAAELAAAQKERDLLEHKLETATTGLRAALHPNIPADIMAAQSILNMLEAK
jgi:chromosome segregation ATPase